MTAIDVALGRECARRRRSSCASRRARRARVADVPAHENVPRIALEVREVLEVAGVRQLVEIDERPIGPPFASHGRHSVPMKPHPPVTSTRMLNAVPSRMPSRKA